MKSTLNGIFWIFCPIFMSLWDTGETYLTVPEDICPANLSECLLGDNHVIACYQSVEKLRVRNKKWDNLS